uniref:Uncharacterized protein n=1 Tax=Rhizophora mucronata TaxID=61149 RepID=A0A2P2NBX5_RHIMU
MGLNLVTLDQIIYVTSSLMFCHLKIFMVYCSAVCHKQIVELLVKTEDSLYS